MQWQEAGDLLTLQIFQIFLHGVASVVQERSIAKAH